MPLPSERARPQLVARASPFDAAALGFAVVYLEFVDHVGVAAESERLHKQTSRHGHSFENYLVFAVAKDAQ
jgi:hypothetical protein